MPAPTSSASLTNTLNSQNALAREQVGLSRMLRGQGDKTFGMSAPAYNTGLKYFDLLVRGGPGALRQLMSTENSLTNQTYQSAKMGLDRAGIRGGVGEYAKAQLDRDKAAQQASMVPGMRYNAADKLLGGGLSGLGAAQGFGGSAVTGMGNAGLTYASMANTQEAQAARNANLWGGLGGSLGKILLNYLLPARG